MQYEIIRNENNRHLLDDEIIKLLKLRDSEETPDFILKLNEAMLRSNAKCEFNFSEKCSESILFDVIVNSYINNSIITLCCTSCYEWAQQNKQQVFEMGYQILIGSMPFGNNES